MNSGYSQIGNAADRPLFGETPPRDRILNIFVGGLTCIVVLITTLSAFVYPSKKSSKGVNSYFSICICLLCASHIILIFWYRQGDVDPKFRFLIYSNTIVIFLLCISACLYIFGA